MDTSLNRRAALGVMAAGAAALPMSGGAATQRHDVVRRYADAWARRDLDAILACMHPSVKFTGPNVSADGRDAYRASTQRFLGLVQQVKVRASVENKGEAMLAYDFICRQPIGTSAVAELVTIKDGLIATSEIFFDTAPFAAFAQQQKAAAGAGK